MDWSQDCCIKYFPKCLHRWGCFCFKRVPGSTSIDLEELEQVAQTGDIILYNEHGAACFQKCFSRSPWVHIGIVIEMGRASGTYGKYLLETTMPSGVTISPLKRSLRFWLHDKDLAQLAYRRLEVKRSEKLLEDIERRAIRLQGRPYEEHYGQIVRAIVSQDDCCRCGGGKDEADEQLQQMNTDNTRQSANICASLHEEEQNSAEAEYTMEHTESEARRLDSLFCSELVALLYQEAGWMDDQFEAMHYLPKDFGTAPNARFPGHAMGGAKLGSVHEEGLQEGDEEKAIPNGGVHRQLSSIVEQESPKATDGGATAVVQRI